MQIKSNHVVGTIIFLVGVCLGLGLAGLAILGDFEAVSYFYSGAGYAGFSGLKCPVLMSPSQVETVSATFSNPSNEVIQPYYQVQISGVAALRNFQNQVPVAPHSSKTVQWTVDSHDIDVGSFVMVKMTISPMAGFSTRQATCGIVVLNLGGLTGEQMVGWGLGLGLLGMVVGLALRERSEQAVAGKAVSIRNALRTAGVLTCLALLTGLGGAWLPGVLFCVLTILLLAIVLRMAVS